VIWNHFRAFLWLRWRLRVNQVKRAGTVNAVLLAILAVGGLFLSLFLFAGAFLVGLFALARVSPLVLLFVWDGLIVFFLFTWVITLAADLQRSEVLSLEKCLHLPVSLTGAFLINYLSSLFSFTLLLFVPAMVGLSLGLAIARGPGLLVTLPLLAAFLFMVTALTNQFQGWLASLMANKRRRRTVIVVVTFGVVLLAQLPNLVINVILPRNVVHGADEEILKETQRRLRALEAEQSQLQGEIAAGRIGLDFFKKRSEEIAHKLQALKESEAEIAEKNKQALAQLESRAERPARIANAVLPPGWLPLGVITSAEGNPLFALPGFLGLVLIGAASLWRSYRTTLRLYTGEFTSGGGRPVAPVRVTEAGRPRDLLLERKLPWLSEQASVIALGGFRSLTRAPEAKMMLLGPVVLAGVFGSVFARREGTMPDFLRPHLMSGAICIVLIGMSTIVGNQFAFDRHGFRVFVLCGASRRDILLGKNLAFAPVTLGLAGTLAAVLQCFFPVSVDHFVAALLQFVSIYLLFCLAANLVSILAPVPVAAGTLRMANPKAIPMLFQFALFLFTGFLAFGVASLPATVEALLDGLGWANGVPVSLLLSAVECTAIVFFYFVALSWEGILLQAREQKILDVVAPKAE
jgi:ABC-2 type transport system permease protein